MVSEAQSNKNHRAPALVLILLAPALGELLLGSSPPREFFSPPALVLLGLMYGGGSLIVRELAVRSGKGWLSVALLGFAYGILEEGLACRSFFDPQWPDLGILGTYGRALGVNWIWTLQLILYHSLVSISLPIAITCILFPGERAQPWLGRKGLTALVVLFLAEILFCFFCFATPGRPPYRPPLLCIAGSVLAATALIFGALRPAHAPVESARSGGRPVSPFMLSLTGFFFMAILLIAPHAAYSACYPPVLAFVLLTFCALLFGALLYREAGAGDFSSRQLIALVTGPLMFLILLSPVQELDNAKRPDDTSGMALVGLGAFIFLIILHWKEKEDRRSPVSTSHREEMRQ
ncbi:MAG: hypothetical protein RDV48_27270 [Candidatus Eremiobacteraeota bacterium]|nr:hypothetical protein [Candidatus Eremiobacteraeota bacterium]